MCLTTHLSCQAGRIVLYKCRPFTITTEYVNIAPAVSLRSSTLSDRLNKDAQFLQTHISSCPHTDDTDTQTITV